MSNRNALLHVQYSHHIFLKYLKKLSIISKVLVKNQEGDILYLTYSCAFLFWLSIYQALYKSNVAIGTNINRSAFLLCSQERFMWD